MIRRLAIVGVGLLGGSVAKAARARGVATEIVGVGRDAGRLEAARRDGVLDRVTTDLASGVRDADVVVLAAPVITILALLEAVAKASGPETIVTDVGSTKREIVATAERLGPLRFVGSHPMAGSEKAGYAHARVDLFHGATVIVTPGEASEPAAVKTIVALWEGVGAARVLTLAPDVHDRAVAAISHLPHLVAFALVDAVERFEPGAFDLAAGGFRDTTRIAAADPTMWEEIFLANREAMAAGLGVFREAIADLMRLVERGDGAALRAAIARIKTRREALQ
ncbi:MAG TPA: prephenate dehydrogenase/arogenate dehydrogenase family protein [Candidatus Acidoferrum sp.]|nr:prephenate dehydrogenase/arogenate dehydrogenase family protein [Candidatus Acidoferrum sp.]